MYAAYDPELDRRVAIKLLRRSDSSRRDPHARMVREAQALARLSHPNVVAVHDVGVHEGRVWVAMDFLEGHTLRRWTATETRSRAAILDVFSQAGQGLSAAHKAGLVHRDFKPDNVIVNAEGRAQVLDFGLARASMSGGPSGAFRGSMDSEAREAPESDASGGSLSMRLTREGALVGTPAYMAPEQHERGPTDERTDQFAFCLALYEALYREPPFAGDNDKELKANVTGGALRAAPRHSDVPSWLRAAILRGMSVNPSDRWPSMDALLQELRRDHGVPRRRQYLAAGGVLLLGSLAAAVVMSLSADPDRCINAAAPMQAIWNDARKDTIHEIFMRTGKPFAAAAWRNSVVILDAHAAHWMDARREACEATWVAGVQPQETLVLRLACLQRRLDELDGLVSTFQDADSTVVERAVQAAHALTAADSCADTQALASSVPLPEDRRQRTLAEDLRSRLSAARTHERSGQYDEGLELAANAVDDARVLAFRPVEAEALVMLGRLQLRNGNTRDAQQTLHDAVVAAEAGGHTSAAAQAWVLLLQVATLHPPLHQDATRWEQHASALVERLGRGSVLDAELQRASGNLLSAQAQHTQAVRHLRRGVEILESRVGETPHLGEMLTDLGNAYLELGRLNDAREHHTRALRILREQLGDHHPDVASAMTGLALAYDELGHPERSYPLYEQVVDIFSEALGPTHPSVATALNNYAGVLHAKGEYIEALQRFERAAAIWEAAYGPEHPDVALTLGNIGLVLEGLERWPEAIDHHRRALALRERAWGPMHPDVEISLRNLGDLHWYRGEFELAREYHRRAVDIIDNSLGADHPRTAAPLEGLAADLVSLGQPELALQHYRRALGVRASALGANHPVVANVLTEIGSLHLDAGDAEQAQATLFRARGIYDKHGQPTASGAKCRFALARAIVATTGDEVQARQSARRALAEFREADPDNSEVSAVQDWLAAHPPG